MKTYTTPTFELEIVEDMITTSVGVSNANDLDISGYTSWNDIFNS